MKKGAGNSAFFSCGKEEKYDPIHLPAKPQDHGTFMLDGAVDWQGGDGW
jgi:hypothetical protein